MKFTNIIFDLDGTITEPAEGITNGFMYALKHFGIEVTDRTSLFKYIGPPIEESFGSIEGFDEAKVTEAVKVYREYYSVNGILENDLMPGIVEALSAMKDAGLKLYVATSKYEPFAVKILQNLKIDQYFDYIAGSDSSVGRNNKTLVLEYLLEKIGINGNSEELKKAVMVGDRKFDVEGAKGIGIESIGVLYGYGDLEEFKLAGADYIVETAKDLADFLCE